jgi:hypothetical protein
VKAEWNNLKPFVGTQRVTNSRPEGWPAIRKRVLRGGEVTHPAKRRELLQLWTEGNLDAGPATLKSNPNHVLENQLADEPEWGLRRLKVRGRFSRRIAPGTERDLNHPALYSNLDVVLY